MEEVNIWLNLVSKLQMIEFSFYKFIFLNKKVIDFSPIHNSCSSNTFIDFFIAALLKCKNSLSLICVPFFILQTTSYL
jgi:hypothetical protein